MRQRAIRPGTGNCREGQIVQAAKVFAEFFQLDGGVDLGDLAALRVRIKPVQEAGQGHAITKMGGGRACKFRVILASLGQSHRVALAYRRCTSLFELVKEPG